MKAAVGYEPGKPLVLEDVTLDPPKYREVKVKLSATAVCHSDIHALNGDLGPIFPTIGGHESAGVVDSVGPGVTTVKPGDHVVVSLVANCGECYFCLSAMPHLCEYPFPLKTESRFKNKKGQSLSQMFKVGGFAEYTIVDHSQVVKIPNDMEMDCAALLACGVITGFGSVVWRTEVKSMHSVVVLGAGGVGLNSVQGAAFSGAYPVIAVDVVDAKLEAAKIFGATHVINAKKTDAIAEVKKLCYGRGADYVFVTVGSGAAMTQGFRMTGGRGTCVIVGLPTPTDNTLSMSPFEFLDRERILTGSYMGSTNLQIGIPKLVELYKAGKLKLNELITNHYPLEKINIAMDEVLAGKALRNLIMF
ncbi:MAG TPA: Zn-dependent alcohol dehydrogenase [Dehalococcoidales bacterium]|nr:Zn-dependent alcohol dehydrogenase [Dehalococcoidales bacterium]